MDEYMELHGLSGEEEAHYLDFVRHAMDMAGTTPLLLLLLLLLQLLLLCAVSSACWSSGRWFSGGW